MKCENNSERISLYIDHKLQEKDLRTFETHLKHCISCQEEVEILQGIINSIHSLEKIELPNGFHEKLMEKIKHEDKPKQKSEQEGSIQGLKKNKKGYLNWRIGGAAAAVFVFSLLIFEFFNVNTSKDAIPESANIQSRSINMEDASPKMAADVTEEGASIEIFDLGELGPVTWEIQTNEYEKCKENIIQMIEEIESEKTVIVDTELDDTNNSQFIIEITLEKSQKDLLLSKVMEICKDDMIEFQENHMEVEDGLIETIMITINKID